MDFSKLTANIKKQKQSLAKKEKTLKLQPGAQRIVLMPGWNSLNPETFAHQFGAHYIKDGDELKAVHLCYDKTFNQPCEVCDALSKAMRAAKDDDTIEALEQCASAQRFLINVLALDSTEPNTPQIMEVPKTVYTSILGVLEDWAEKVFDPTDAQILVIDKSGKGLSTRYTVQASPKTHKVPAAALANIPNLDEYVQMEPEEQTTRTLNALNAVAGTLPAVARVSRTTAPALEAPTARVAAKPELDDELDALLASDELTDIPG